MGEETVLYEKREKVGWITLNRPKVLNAINRPLVNDLLQILKGIEKDSDVRVVVLKGNGKAFCSGDDLSEDFSDIKTSEQAYGNTEGLGFD